ncbi:MAG TPA: DedA family protein [Myxococcota bacterium]|nr:DedA family protein [Myxococcota bacterium]HOA13764.1 DedA family protein [Myxococcota bacterium]HOC98794.1 DedA family protein [Myxococcota bacterium]HOH76790.1 DedA family protein [Myxococcota bacterium]HPV03503.1 DedA family protein [Myxococcota bacterium]
MLQDALTGGRQAAALAALFHASLIEYVFPVFPGDTVTIAGAVLAVTSGLPLWGVFAATMAGGLAGSALDFWIGRAFGRGWKTAGPEFKRRHPWLDRVLGQADRLSTRFARHGTVLLLANRMMPGIRSLLFVAAGMAGMSFVKSMLAGLVSNAAWTGLLMLAGLALGANLDSVVMLFRTYSVAVWCVIAAALGLWLTAWIRRRRTDRREAGP